MAPCEIKIQTLEGKVEKTLRVEPRGYSVRVPGETPQGAHLLVRCAVDDSCSSVNKVWGSSGKSLATLKKGDDPLELEIIIEKVKRIAVIRHV